MGKIIGFELKKLVSRIGIYILVVLLAGLLVAGVFMYKPHERTIATKSLVGETVSDMYNDFNNNIKQDYLDTINEISVNASTYIPNSANYVKYSDAKEINKLFTEFDNNCLLFDEAIATNKEHNAILGGIRTSLNNLISALDQVLFDATVMEDYYILTTKKNYQTLSALLIKTQANFASVASNKLVSEAYLNNLRVPLSNSLNELVYPDLESNAKKYTSNGIYHSLTTARISEIESKMESEYQKVVLNPSLEKDNEIRNNLNELFNRYIVNVDNFVNAYKASMYVNAIGAVSDKTERNNLYGYDKVLFYEQEELAVKYQYYIENNKSEADFATGLSVTHTSNGEINAYDFTFFIMSLFAVVVMIFAIYLAANTIAGEISNNTMRLTAIRPVKRGSIFFGKYLSILIISLILLVFGTITSLIVGGILFGFNNTNILTIINNEFIFVAHPAVLISIFVFSLFLMIVVYSAFTLLLSSMFKSDLFAMVLGVVLYAVNLILPLFFDATSWLKFYPFTNLNIFAYFGTTKLTTDSVLADIFNAVVYQGMNLWISLVYIFGITTLLLLIGRLIFKKREL